MQHDIFGWRRVVICVQDIDECQSDPCVHGECIDQINGYVCKCKDGWTGTNCETGMNLKKKKKTIY